VAVLTGPCAPWDPIWCTACDLPTGSEAVTGAAVQAATEILWEQSNQRFGPCEVTIRPCRRDCNGGGWPFADQWWEWGGNSGWPRPLLYAGVWSNVTCGSCPGTCSCGTLEEAILPAPVYQVVRVLVDGSPLVTGAYRVDDNRILVRTDGGRWPICQALDLPDTAVGTWSVTVQVGEPVPTIGRQAVGELACEIARACMGEECRLPANIASLARQGINISFPAGQDVAERLYFVGLFLDTYNPGRLRGRAQVYDVDGPSFRRVGT
jgi:hypothetical protein